MHTFNLRLTRKYKSFADPIFFKDIRQGSIHFLRLVTIATLVLFIWLLSTDQSISLGEKSISSLDIFWKLIVPIVPIVLLVVPSLWRNICPLATINVTGHYLRSTLLHFQRPRTKHHTAAGIKLFLAKHGLYVAMSLLFILVPGRLLLFNESSTALAFLLLLLVIFTFLLGLVLPFKSGWCSSICPVYVVEKTYGTSPLIDGDNTLCRVESPDKQSTLSCGGCTRNCLDLKISNHRSKSSRWLPTSAARLFISIFPGFIMAYFLLCQFTTWQKLPSILQCLVAYGSFTALMLLSFAVHYIWYHHLTAKGPRHQESTKHLDLVFIALSFNIYYLMATPGLVSTLGTLLQLNETIMLISTLSFLLVVLITSLYWLRRAW